MGWRGRSRGRYPGRGPFSNLPPWERPGWIYGYGRGSGYPASTVDPTVCQRFPWLPRWWWADPDAASRAVPFPSADEERRFLERQTKALQEEIGHMKKRLDELVEEKDQE